MEQSFDAPHGEGTAPERAAADLAEAEKIARISARHDGPVPGWIVVALLAEVDRLRAIEQRAVMVAGEGSSALPGDPRPRQAIVTARYILTGVGS